MTPQEKAKELVDKFLYANKGHFYQDSPLEDLEAAKECALVAVDELLNVLVYSPTDYGASIMFCSQVKKEIEKL